MKPFVILLTLLLAPIGSAQPAQAKVTLDAYQNVKDSISRDTSIEKHPGPFLHLGKKLLIKKSSIEVIEATSDSVTLSLASGSEIIIKPNAIMFDPEFFAETIEAILLGQREIIDKNTEDLIKISAAIKYYQPFAGEESADLALRWLRKLYTQCLTWDWITDYCDISRQP